ncbi:TIM-barrel domain-containing protein [Microbacterium indicum]|uniref:glycoside hydrolase family 31 protein n=1 Tax=Microbacterium indicum TaxID=358100 RepID=UPI000407436D|nr:TIM-barrel domain-containing protein [Microbacterium indicum]
MTDTELPVVRPLPEAAPRAAASQQVRGDRWRVTVLTDRLFRIEWAPDGAFEDRASTFAIRRELPPVDFTQRPFRDGVEIRTGAASLRYDGREFSSDGLLVQTLGHDGRRWRYGEPTYDLGGTARTLDRVDGRTELDTGVVSMRGTAVIDDSESFLFEDDGWIGTRTPGGRDLYVFAYGRDFAGAVAALYDVSGHPMRLPRGALGNWWSRYHAYSDAEYLDLMDRFDAAGVPFSVAVIDMDWHRVASVPPEYGTGWTGYSWERDLFPDPEGFLGKLHDRGMRTTLNVHPADGVRAFEDPYPAMAEAMGVDPATGQTVAFDATDRRFVEAYFRELHHPLEAQGVDFWWLDWQQGSTSNLPGVDPLWLLNHFHHLDAARAGAPGMTFSRYAGPGSHRYAVGFSGDTVMTWASLDFQPEFTATASNIGYSWWSHDIGGHTHGVRDDELVTRWVQYGVFSPILRLHSSNNPFIRKEPWNFPAEHRDAMVAALRLRHALVPYLHTMNHRAASGVPLVRPMHHLEPHRPEAFDVPNQYAFGSELLVAPITSPRDPASLLGRAGAWLPEGTWTDVFTGTVYRGDRRVDLHRAIDAIPVLLRAGGILPLAGDDDLDATRNPRAVEVIVAPSAAGRFVLAEDAEDDTSTSAAPGATTEIAWDPETGELRIGAATGDAAAVPAERAWTATFLAARPDRVLVDGSPVDVAGEDGRWSVSAAGPTAREIVVTVEGGIRVGPDRRDAMSDVLARAQMANDPKLAAWAVLEGDRPAIEKAGELAAIDLPESVRAALTELLAAVVDEARG